MSNENMDKLVVEAIQKLLEASAIINDATKRIAELESENTRLIYELRGALQQLSPKAGEHNKDE